MKIPKSPPSFYEAHTVLPEIYRDADKAKAFFQLQKSLNSNLEYLHWDQLRFKPSPQNFSMPVYWYAIKLQRSATRVDVPLNLDTQPPACFHYTRPDFLLSQLRQIDIKSGGLVSTRNESVVDIESKRYLTRSILEEPFSSSVLEGAATTREKARAMIEKNEHPDNESDQMVLNNYRAMMFIKEHIDKPLSPDLVLECHAIITEKTLERPEMSGKFRDNDSVEIIDQIDGTVYHHPPKFSELPDRLRALCDFANQTEETERFVHPVVRAIILHFMLSYDHPFIDGNGRTARAIFYWSMLRSGYWLMEFVSISAIIKRAPIKYGRAFLYTETDEGDLTYFILHQLGIILTALDELGQYLEKQKKKHTAAAALLTDTDLNYRQRALLTEFGRQRILKITIKEHERLNRISYLTARQDLETLTAEKWLKKNASGKPSIYTAGKRLIDIIAEEKKP